MLSFEELMQDNDFVKWALKKPCREKSYWDDLYAEAKGKEKEDFIEAIRSVNLLKSVDVDKNIKVQTEDKIEEGLRNIHFRANQINKPRIRLLGIMKYAAAIIILISLGIIWRNYIRKETDIFKNHLVESAQNANNILIENQNGVFYGIPEKEQSWKTDHGVLIAVNHNSISFSKSSEFNSAGNESMTIHVPSRNDFKINMIDGTDVHLNANTAFEFSINSTSEKRLTKLEGGAYFSVAHNKSRPFIVETSRMNIEVLGTAFNIMAYANEKTTETTLIQGSVKVKHKNGKAKIIQPGDIASVLDENSEIIVEKADINKSVMWMSGSMVLQDDRLEDILLNLGRWYGVNFNFESDKLKNLRFTGELGKDLDLTDILNRLEFSKGIEFKVNNNNIFLKEGS